MFEKYERKPLMSLNGSMKEIYRKQRSGVQRMGADRHQNRPFYFRYFAAFDFHLSLKKVGIWCGRFEVK